MSNGEPRRQGGLHWPRRRRAVTVPARAVPAPAPGDEGATVLRPARLLRLAAMVAAVREEIHAAPLDGESRRDVRATYERVTGEAARSLPPPLRAELERLLAPLATAEPSTAELRIAEAQLAGWLDGVFRGIETTILIQESARTLAAARAGATEPPGGSGNGAPPP